MRWAELLKWADVDRAVVYALAMRLWQFPAGLATALLLAFCFTRDQQGYYYTIATLLGAQTFLDLGLPWVILHAASHEWEGLSLDAQGAVTGSPRSHERLAALARVSRRWFLGVAVLFAACVFGVGSVLLARSTAEVAWQVPFLLVVLLAATSLSLIPRIVMLEGCDRVLDVNRTRLLQAVTGSLAVWACMIGGLGLWALVASAAVQVLWEAWLTLIRYRPFWRSLRDCRAADFDWKTEVWPLQWRSALQSLVYYLAFQLFTPVTFAWHGAELAGRMGMSWSILSNIQQAAFAPARTRAPRLGLEIARRQFQQLDARFFRMVLVSTGILLLGFAAFGGLLLGLVWLAGSSGLGGIPGPAEASASAAEAASLAGRVASQIMARLLPLPINAALAAGLVAIHLAQLLGLYLRAHKRDPLVWLLTASNLLIALTVYLAGRWYGPAGASLGFALLAWLVTLPGVSVVWYRCRKQWHDVGEL